MTLAEALTATIFVSWVSAMSYSFTRAALHNARAQEARRELEQAHVLAADILMRELRQAGFSAAGELLSGVRSASARHIEVAADLNGDGDVDDANERVSYRYDADKRCIMRATGGGSPQPFLRNVPEDGFRLQYADRDGQWLGTGGAVDAESRARIASIMIHLEVAGVPPDRSSLRPAQVELNVSLRNR
jgi:type II secretory pathway component PulJ